MNKLRTPTKADKENAERWLRRATDNLAYNVYYLVKQLCKQVIHALRRKDKEGRT